MDDKPKIIIVCKKPEKKVAKASRIYNINPVGEKRQFYNGIPL